ncbi:hypothetical protein DMC47_13355 [Nostoc sp. 3335mG]|nr:hypothetical protein DMC47_13355 [Nostoc sp. 3335mG]
MTFDNSGNSSTGATDAKTWAIVIWGLFIGGAITGGIATIVGVILAYVKRDDLRGTPFESHVTSAIRTFWISLVGALIGVVLMFILIGVLVLIAVAVWVLFRSVRGLVFALDSKPIADPAGWL